MLLAQHSGTGRLPCNWQQQDALRPHHCRSTPETDPGRGGALAGQLQAYDTGGTKTPFDKKNESKRGLGNRFGCVLVEGRDLHETLLFNTVQYHPAAA